MSPYAALVELARRETQLVASGRWEELPALADERAALAATLPDVPPAEARPQLEEAARLVTATGSAVSAAMAFVRVDLERLAARRRGVSAYAAAAK